MPWKENSIVDQRLRFVARLLEGESMTDVRSGSAKLNRQNKCNIGVLRHGIEAVAGDRHEQIIRAAYTPRV